MEKFEDLAGKTIVKVKGLHDGSDEVLLELEDGSRVTLYHEQDCCEHVRLYDLVGDEDMLLNTPVLFAYETVNEEFANEVKEPKDEDDDFSRTWTFYRIGTIKGVVIMRWLGTSNGYYSESVSVKFDAP